MPARRSGRIRRPNQNYQEAQDLSFLDADSDVDGPPAQPQRKVEDDDEFQIVTTDVGHQNDGAEDTEGLSDQDAPTPPSSDQGSADPDERLSDVFQDDDSSIDQTQDSPEGKSSKGASVAQRSTMTPGEQLYSQAAETVTRHTNHDGFINFAFGQDSDEVTLLLASMDAGIRDATVPSRTANDHGSAGTNPSPFANASPEEEHALHNWLQANVESERFLEGQILRSLSATAAARFLPAQSAVQFVAMPSKEVELQRIESAGHMRLDDVWPAAATGRPSNVARPGFLVNTGENVHQLAWLPVDDSTAQYLAVATRPQAQITHVKSATDSAAKSAFVPGDPLASAIQIWQFAANEVGQSGSYTFNLEIEPVRFLVLCGFFGHSRDIKWSPMAVHSRKGGPLGMLATVHDDGNLRVFALDFPKTTTSKSTQYLKAESAAMKSRPPHTVFTCVEWISPDLLAAGCADGHVAIFDMQEYFDAPPRKADATPYFYHAIHDSYIFSISTCSPSRPELLISTSVDGLCKVTDLRDPLADVAEMPRQRLPDKFGIWFERGQGVLSTDDLPSVRIVPIRRVNVSSRVARLESALTSLVASSLHHSVLCGTADGSAFATNPAVSWWRLRSRAPWKQPWFKHEWRPGKPAGNDGGELDFPNGLTRLTTGLKMQQMTDMSRNEVMRGGKKAKESREVNVIHEKATAVTSLAWNPNVPVGGWAAAGMGDGLLWVEDIAWS